MEIVDREPEPQKRLDEFGDGIVIKPFNWKDYNNSQVKEKTLFLKLLKDLTKVLEKNQTYVGKGRPAQTTSHMIFCMCMKVFLNASSRRIISDLTLCQKSGYIKTVPHFNSVLAYFDSNAITKNLKYLIRLSALPLVQLEKTFSVDSSGIAEHKYLPRWSAIRQEYRKHRDYKKIHCIVGNQSNIIASTMVSEGTKGDSPYFQKLLQEVAENFDPLEVSADMAYLSRSNLKFADDLGITPFIPFKKNSKGPSKGARIWNKMYKYFKENPKEFGKHYHLRSNSESTFFMLKKRFGEFVYAKNDLCQINEILCKILCHNITVLIQELFLSDIDIDFIFCAKQYVAHE